MDECTIIRREVSELTRQPIAELFGFPPESETEEAQRYRRNRLCPYNNKVPNCTKDSVVDPLGVCTIFHGKDLAVICPVRLRQEWIIAEHAAEFFFPIGARWTTLIDVPFKDKSGKSAGQIDVVLISYDERGILTDFGLLEILPPYVNYRLRRVPSTALTEADERGFCRVGALKSSNKRIAIAIDESSFETLHTLIEVPKEEAEIAWLVYGLEDSGSGEARLHLTHRQTFYSRRPNFIDQSRVLAMLSKEEILDQLEYELDTFQLEGRA